MRKMASLRGGVPIALKRAARYNNQISANGLQILVDSIGQ